MSITVLNRALHFPDPHLANSKGLVAIGGDLSVERLLLAYRTGVFPWTVSPISWWSPDPRAILEPDQVHIPDSLRKVLRKETFRITIDQAFARVIENCAERVPGRSETWITSEFIGAYTRLHEEGHAHSVECWLDGELAGGIYGVAIGGFFAGESMFHRVSNASKVALCHLARHLQERRFALFDIQMLTPVTKQMGGLTIPRERYLVRLKEAVTMDCEF
ncbi:MAG TPA: leucyl/phenylalanyl-tRNA--protein transferase [Candidatus Angelobacter sp.]|nr:leucyl/phenylalanyl-tRNA--protein transferase [Candidatus Angelobacter sp.]